MDFTSIITMVLNLIREHGALGVVVGVLIESVIAPIPSPVVILGAGFILLPENVPFIQILFPLFFNIILPGAIATTFGSFIGYGIGYYGGKPLIKKFNWLLGVDYEELTKGVNKFEKGVKDEITIFMMRAIPVIPLSVFSATAGLLRINKKTFTIYTFLGSMVRIAILAIIGWFIGSAYGVMASSIDNLESIVTNSIIGISILFLIYLIWKNKFAKKKKLKQ